MAHERAGKTFDLGAPYLSPSGGISYFWPDMSGNYASVFKSRIGDLGDALLERSREMAGPLGVRSSSRHYPHLQRGEHLTVHIGEGGRWVEIGAFIANGMAAFHNLDGYADQALGFDLASHALEFLDPQVLAPRIAREGGTYSLAYPFPRENGPLPLQREPGRWMDWLERQADSLRLGGIAELTATPDSARIVLEQGHILIGEGMCRGHGFRGYDAIRATGLLAKIVDSSSLTKG